MGRLYLEISGIGSACGKMKFEPRERTLLFSWARHDPIACKNFLIKNEYITTDNNDTDLFEDHSRLVAKRARDVSFINTKVEDFNGIAKDVKNDLKELRTSQGKELTATEVKNFNKHVEKYLNTTFGKNSEEKIVSNVGARVGNNKMYYYNISDKWCIGGKHDADKSDMVIEIKTRMKEINVRKNEYDLYQILGYLLAMGLNKGKIIQQYNNKTFDSDVETGNEYGIIDSVQYSKEISVMLSELECFFQRLEEIISSGEMTKEELSIAIQDSDKPLCVISNDEYINKKSKYSKLFFFI